MHYGIYDLYAIKRIMQLSSRQLIGFDCTW